MNIDGDYFAEYFAAAQIDALSERESRMIELRYGFIDGEPHTLEEIGRGFGISRERVRQILKKSHRRILSKAYRQVRSGKTDQPCAELLLYLRNTIRPQDDRAVDRLVAFIENNLSHLPANTHALELVTYLAYPNSQTAYSDMAEARKLIREREFERRRNYRQARLSARFQGLLSHVIWPSEVRRLTREEITAFKREREISSGSKGNAGVFHSDKMNRAVQYESELELDFLHRLEQLKEVVSYQEQPFKVPYDLDGQKFVYYPDVLFVLEDGRGVVVEIKPVFEMALQGNLIKWAALRQFCTERGLGILITDGRYTIQQIQYHKVRPEFADAVVASLRHGPLSWKQYKEIRDKYNASRNDFVALILKNRLVWDLSPFRLSINAQLQ